MNKLKFSLFLVIGLVSINSFAFHQKVKVCLNVQNNSDKNIFYALFRSTDKFSDTYSTKNVVSGSDCVTYTYKKGPKTLHVGVYNPSRNIVFTPSIWSCSKFNYNNST